MTLEETAMYNQVKYQDFIKTQQTHYVTKANSMTVFLKFFLVTYLFTIMG